MQRILSQKNIIKRGSQTCYRYMIATFAGKTDNVSSLFSQFTSWGGQALLPLVLGEAFPDGPNSSGWWISCLINYLATIHIYVDNMYKYIYIYITLYLCIHPARSMDTQRFGESTVNRQELFGPSMHVKVGCDAREVLRPSDPKETKARSDAKISR